MRVLLASINVLRALGVTSQVFNVRHLRATTNNTKSFFEYPYCGHVKNFQLTIQCSLDDNTVENLEQLLQQKTKQIHVECTNHNEKR